MYTLLILQCPIPSCPNWIKAEFEPGESQTLDYPGSPDWWYIFGHTPTNNEDDTKHMDQINASEFQSLCHITAAECWDNNDDY